MDQNIFRRIGPLLLTIFIDLLGFSIIFPLYPAMLTFYKAQELNWEASLLGGFIHYLTQLAENHHVSNPGLVIIVLFGGIVGSLYSVLQFIWSPVWGKWSDRIGRRPILQVTIWGTSLSYAVWIFADSFSLFLLARMLAGVMAGNLAVANAAVADLTTKADRGRGMALLGMAFSLGFIVGPAMGGMLSMIDLTQYFPNSIYWGVHPFSLPAMVACLLAFMNGLWVTFGLKETLVHRNTSHEITSVRARIYQMFVIKDRNILLLNCTNFLFSLVLSGLEFTLTFLALERFQFTPKENIYLFLFIGFVMPLTQGLLARNKALSGKEIWLLRSGLVIGVITYSVLGTAATTSQLYVGACLLAISTGLVVPMLSTLVSLSVKESVQGQYIGLLRSAGSLARALGPIGASVIYFYKGSVWCYVLGSCVLLIPLVIATRLAKPKLILEKTLIKP